MTLKSARAVMILVPIFGVHFLLLPMRPVEGSVLEYPYEVTTIMEPVIQVTIAGGVLYLDHLPRSPRVLPALLL